MTRGEYRCRIRYAKIGRLRWLSHLEVVRALERIIRRSGLPFAVTQGFNPHMKAAFGPALPVGTAGESEYFDVWLRGYTEAAQVLQRLRDVAPGDLIPTAVTYVGDREPSLSAALTIARYVIDVIIEEEDAHQRVQAGMAELLSQERFEVQHKGKTKFFDVRRSVPEDVVVESRADGVRIMLTVRSGPEGSLRPDALIRAVLANSQVNAITVRTTRTESLVEADGGVWARPM